VNIVETWYDAAFGGYAPAVDVWTLSRELPWLLARFNSYAAFSKVRIEEALGDQFAAARVVEAAWLDSTILLNRGGRFVISPLPMEAQRTAAFGPCAADFDGDGHVDLFLSQNFFGVRPGDTRYDAGRGLMLRGDGAGGFEAMSAEASGVTIYGEQRGAAVSDYDGDGRMDLAVAVWGDATRVFRNEQGRRGLRVRLRGKPGNPQAFGAQVRLRFGATWGPAHEVHAGGGYWSQDGAVPVLAQPQPAAAIWVRWPGGATSETPLPGQVLEIELRE
jgi:hypothetical protein